MGATHTKNSLGAVPGPRRAGLGAAAALALLLAACGGGPSNRAAVVLIDISGEYAREVDKARQVTSYLLGSLNPGDSIAVAFIDNTSYTERNFIARADFDHRPSVANDQKRQVRAKLDAFLDDFDVPSWHSDLTGGILLGRDFLDSTGADTRQLFLLSDLDEDLKPELDRDVPLELAGIEVVAVNVIRRDGDNVDPQHYRERIAGWQQRVVDNGGQWRVVDRIERLQSVVAMR